MREAGVAHPRRPVRMTLMVSRKPLVEVLYFDGCPNHEGALALVEEVAAELGIDPEVRLVDVPDADAAEQLRFLGSPTVRVGGRDVEPGADARTGFALACRVYRSGDGVTGVPPRDWIHAALARGRTA